MAPPLGVEPSSHGLTVRPHTPCVKGNIFGAEGETRTHGGFPTAYKTVAIAAMRLQHLNNNLFSIVTIHGNFKYVNHQRNQEPYVTASKVQAFIKIASSRIL